MTTFLWMLYLAFTLFITSATINNLLVNIFSKEEYDKIDFVFHVITCLLWSIWYFYYLN